MNNKKTERKIKATYLLGAFNETTWKGSLEEAKIIALAEIAEHAGSTSAAYSLTKAVFNYYEKNEKELSPSACLKAKKESMATNVLHNDETSTDDELLEYFQREGKFTKIEADLAVLQRDSCLKDLTYQVKL